jgi:hypothetical protein
MGTTSHASEAEFAKSAIAILTDAEHDYHQSALVHLACAIFASGGDDVEDVTMTPRGNGHVLATQAGRASAFLQMTIADGKEYLYETPAVAAFSASERLPASDYSKWLSLGALPGGASLSLFNSILRLATNSAEVFDETAPITKGSTETVRGRKAIDIHWQNNVDPGLISFPAECLRPDASWMRERPDEEKGDASDNQGDERRRNHEPRDAPFRRR